MAVVEGSVGMIPVAGNPLAVAVALAMGWAYNKRWQGWLQSCRSASISASTNSETTTFSLTRWCTHLVARKRLTRPEKLAALRNAVLNCLGPGAPKADEQAQFFSLVDRFTPSHLRVLAFMG